MGKQIANLTSGILSPFVIGLVLIALVSFEASDSPSSAIKWSLLLVALNLLPVFLFTLYLVHYNRLDSIFAGTRRQRIRVYTLAVILSGVSCIILSLLRAPSLLLALSVAGCSAIIVFTVVNLWWKISLHTAFITAAVTVVLILYGFIAIPAIVLIPLVAWARIELAHHSLAQVISGGSLGALTLVAVFYLFAVL